MWSWVVVRAVQSTARRPHKLRDCVSAQTPLGRRLRELRSEIMKSGITPLGWDEIQEESHLATRRLARAFVKLTFVDAGVLIAAARRAMFKRHAR
jgi:hypothetical protein